MEFRKQMATVLIATVVAAYAAGRAAADDIRFASDLEHVALDATIDLASFGAGGESSGCSTCCSCCADPWVVSREPIFCHSHLDCLTNLATSIDNDCNFKMPFSGGAWHWFHQSLIGRPGGYGIPTIRDTYFWYLYADPEYTTAAGNSCESVNK